jgi:hypothetical protein
MTSFRLFLDRLVAQPLGVLAVLAVAALLEAFGDSFFQAGFYRSAGAARIFAIVAGAAVLAVYGCTVNVPRWDFGRLIGVYVAFFFLGAQLINRIRFGHSPAAPICAGGALIVAGALVMTFWKP